MFLTDVVLNLSFLGLGCVSDKEGGDICAPDLDFMSVAETMSHGIMLKTKPVVAAEHWRGL